MTPEEKEAFKESLKPKRYNHIPFWVRYREIFGDLEKEQEMIEIINCYKDFSPTSQSSWEARQVLLGKRLPLKTVYLVMGSGGAYQVKSINYKNSDYQNNITNEFLVILVDDREFLVKETEMFFFS